MRLLFEGETVTRTERVSQGLNRNSSLTGHTNGVALIGPALLELIYPLASRKTLVLNALSKCSGKDS